MNADPSPFTNELQILQDKVRRLNRTVMLLWAIFIIGLTVALTPIRDRLHYNIKRDLEAENFVVKDRDGRIHGVFGLARSSNVTDKPKHGFGDWAPERVELVDRLPAVCEIAGVEIISYDSNTGLPLSAHEFLPANYRWIGTDTDKELVKWATLRSYVQGLSRETDEKVARLRAELLKKINPE